METRTMKWIGLALVAAVLFTIAPAAQAAYPSGSYRIAFITSEKPNPGTTPEIPATGWDMDDLNNWVARLANDTGSLVKDMADDWYVVGATTGRDVYTNTGMDPSGPSDIPIYLVGNATLGYGLPFADNYADFWSSVEDGADPTITMYETDKVVYWTETGGTWSDPIHTGLNATGTTGSDVDPVRPITYEGLELDSGDKVGQGGTNAGYIYDNKGFYGNGDDWGGAFGQKPLLVISEVIPEPATMSLLAIGGVALLRRKRNS